MAFQGTGLTELGPYGVPVSITLPLFGDGSPLTIVIVKGIIQIQEIERGDITLETAQALAFKLNTTLQNEVALELEKIGLIGPGEANARLVVDVEETGIITLTSPENG